MASVAPRVQTYKSRIKLFIRDYVNLIFTNPKNNARYFPESLLDSRVGSKLGKIKV